MTARPLVAMTCHYGQASWGGWTAEAVITHAWYAQVVRRAGGRVVLVPPDPDVDDLVDRVDAVVITGGADVHPTRYGQQAHGSVEAADDERDAADLALARQAWKQDVPLLGICRGLQVMAVAMGGSLVQHLPEVSPLVHLVTTGSFVDHHAHVHEGTLAARVLGSGRIAVNSSHHQAVLDPGPLRISAVAEDGTVEACEDPSRTFCLGVQWHPEHPDQWSGEPLFQALVQAARQYRVAH